MERSSRLLVNTGEGKGKSSAAFGVMSRGWARGWHVVVIQFVKGGKWKTGERKLADQLGIEFHTLGDGFTWESDDLETTAHLGQEAWNLAKTRIDSDEYDLVILDELTYAITYGWIDERAVIDTLRERPTRTNIVITGRGATPGLIEVADTVTEMRKIKHAYDQGIKAKKGIEY
ncbi:MAG: cob(I)yrinic acid a,c-diamide adenosyltransferase [Ferrimicrobium sp.]|jgi:cob(I)alamin adenosyltransferase|nr:cob(I)yrinic acid a,c-diamide adenosyltransferase [Ferrimicrobium sp.]